MKSKEYWEKLVSRNKDSCFLADTSDKTIFYVNGTLEKKFGAKKDILGKVYYQVLAERHFVIINNASSGWDMTEDTQVEVYNKRTNENFVCTLSVFPESTVICCFIIPISQNGEVRDSFEEALDRCIAVLNKEDRNLALLEILGRYYDCDKTYLYQIDKVNNKIPCMYHWMKDETVTYASDLSEKMPIDKLFAWYDTRNEVGILDVAREHSNYSPQSLGGEVLDRFRLDNLVCSIVEDSNHAVLGKVSMGNRRNLKADFRLLQTVTMFMEKELTQVETQICLEQLNDKDILTGFYNRSAYANKIDQLRENPPKALGVFLANVNGLKKVNTEFGYAKGDSYIKQASVIMKKYFDATFYRVAGDEFVAFFPEVDKAEFEAKIQILQKELKEKHNHHFAIGHAWREGRYDSGQLISEADTVMYINKQEYYHSSKVAHYDISDSTLSDLLSYLENEEFMIYLQPQVRLDDESLHGAEALIRRFDKKNQKMVFPDQFISLYEQKSVIRHVDMFVVEAVCKLLSKWHKKGTSLPISVNLSRVTLQEYGIVDTIVEICDKYQVPHNLLVIEVTERVGLVENNVASSLVNQFKSYGFSISLDDFGCAYSNIVTLAQIEVDEVKLDKSLVDDLITNKKNHILVKNVLTMCNELEGASTLAEGIEDIEQAKLLYALHCHLGQGYYYSRPIPVQEFCEKYVTH